MSKTKIEWSERVWNPLAGCSIVSPGCTNCYAMKMAHRLAAMDRAKRAAACTRPLQTFPLGHYAELTKVVNNKPVWTGKVARAPDRTLFEPLRRKRPTMYFVNSMSDLFHEDVPDEWIDRVLSVMALCPQHTFQVLTKRSARMRAYFAGGIDFDCALQATSGGATISYRRLLPSWPLPNVWLGVSAERQKEADERIPDLLATPAAVRFVSAEPLLGPIDFQRIDWNGSTALCALDRPGIDWIIVGGESGPDARPMHPDWVRSIRHQCVEAGVPFFFKQWGAWAPGHRHPVGEAAGSLRRMTCISSTDRRNVGRESWLAGCGDYSIPLTLIGKSRAGRLLDGREWNEMPGASKYDQSPTDPHHGGKVSA